jgi:transcriptional regulator with XRE-family HTH domain
VYDPKGFLRAYGVHQKLSPQDLRVLGQTIVKHRTRLALTQEQLAEKSSIDGRFLQKVEAGELGASLAVLKRLRKALKVGWDDLLKGL